MKKWVKSGIKSLYVTIPIMFFISIVWGFRGYIWKGSFEIIEPLKAFFIFTTIITLIVLLISYAKEDIKKHKKQFFKSVGFWIIVIIIVMALTLGWVIMKGMSF